MMRVLAGMLHLLPAMSLLQRRFDERGFSDHAHGFEASMGFENEASGPRLPDTVDTVCRDFTGHAGLDREIMDMDLNHSADGATLINTSAIIILGKELKSACFGSTWNGARCQTIASAIRSSTWPRLQNMTTGVPTFRHLRSHSHSPPLKLFHQGGGVHASVPCRRGKGTAELYYRHIYKSAGMAIKNNLAKLSHEKHFKDPMWHSKHLCKKITHSREDSNRPILFTFVRDPMEKFIAGFKEIASRGLINNIRGSEVGSIEHATLFLDNVFHGTCDNGHVLLQIQNMMGPECESRFDYVGKLENFLPDWHQLGDVAGCTKKLKWPREYHHKSDLADKGADVAMRAALAASGGKLAQALCIWLLPDYIAFDYPLPAHCNRHADLLNVA